MFVDEIRVFARAGHGGKGCVAFRRESSAPKGGPSGGNGGRGGNVVLEADHDLNNLIAQYYQPRLIADDGQPGLGKGMDGRAGDDLVVKVPCGSVIWRLDEGSAVRAGPEPDEDTPAIQGLPLATAQRPVLACASGEAPAPSEPGKPSEHARPVRGHPRGELVADLTRHGQRFVLCRGGRGGLGNRNFATARRQTPRFAQPGEPGQEGEFLIELRIVADVGLIGYPNAGKSTLLSAISAARPKIAPYPFTTLHPQVGIVEYPGYQRLVVCDVPGLIEGAHRNVGLGHAFLRHIERCQVLVFLVDMAGTDSRQPWDDYRQLLSELGLYDPRLLERPRLVVANKMDEATAESNLRKFRRRVPRTPVLPIAAAFDEGLDKFKQAIRSLVTVALAS